MEAQFGSRDVSVGSADAKRKQLSVLVRQNAGLQVREGSRHMKCLCGTIEDGVREKRVVTDWEEWYYPSR